MNNLLVCPDPLDLQRLAFGELSDPLAKRVGSHVLACTACARRLDALQVDDPLVGYFQGVQDRQTLDDPLVNGLVERLLQAPPDSVLANDSRQGGLEQADDNDATMALSNKDGSRRSGKDWGPATVPGYEILDELGRGGMGVVYKARHLRLQRLVALKMVLGGGHAGSADRLRFLAEAEAIAALHHANIVQVYDFGQHDGLPYMALEYVNGGNLGSRLREQTLPAHDAAWLVEQLARGVAEAHAKGIVHRDLKPHNVLLSEPEPSAPGAAPLRNCTPKVTDFGLAKKMAGSSGLTQTGALMGTPSYMAPEQAEGKKTVGPPADIYALGAILYECLTGRPPFRGPTTLETTLQVLNEEPASVRQLQPQTPRDLENICLKCLRKEPEKRYGTATALAEDLRRFQTGEAVQARPVGRLERLVKWARRNPLVAALVATVALGAILATFFAVQASRTADREIQARQRAERLLYFSTIQLAHQDWHNGQVADAVTRLAECRPDLRSWEHAYLTRLCRGAARTFGGHTRPLACVAFSPDGKRIVSGTGLDYRERDQPEEVKVWDADTGRLLLTLPGHSGPVWAVAFSPDGTRIVSAGVDRTVRLWDASNGQLLRTLVELTNAVRSVAFSPDGKRLVGAAWDGQVMVWGLDKSREVFSFQTHPNTLCMALSPNGKRIVTGAMNGAVQVWDVASGQEVSTFKRADQPVLQVAFSPDGKRVASVGCFPDVQLCDAEKGNNAVALKGQFGGICGVAFWPDGKRLASATADGVVRVWNIDSRREAFRFKVDKEVVCMALSPDGKRIASDSHDGTLTVWDVEDDAWESRPLLGHTHGSRSVAISGDGRRVVSGGGVLNYPRNKPGELLLWDADTRQVLQRLAGHLAPVRGVDIRWDGRRIVSGSEDKTLKVWDADTGRELFSCQGHHDIVRSVAFSPDGNWIASAGHDNTVKVWDAATGEELRTLRGHANWVTSVAFSADGLRLVSGSDDKTAKVWNASTGQELLTLQGHTDKILRVAFSGDGKQVLSTGVDKTVRVWDVRTGRQLLVIQANGELVDAVSFSPDGQRIVGGNGEFVRVWDAATGQPALSLRRHKDRVSGLAFSRDGRRLVSGSFDGTVHVWEAGP